MKKLITTIFIFLSLTSFSQVGGNKYTIVVKGDSTGGSSIDSAELAAKLILKANQSALIDSATALRSGINTKQPLLGFTPYNVTNPAGYIGNAALSPYLLSATAASTYLGTSGNGSALTGLTKGQVGLANVDNTSDANKPVSTAQLTALNLKQNSLSGTGLVRMTGATVSYDNATYLTSVPAQSYASLTGKPTTLSGYGITDATPKVVPIAVASTDAMSKGQVYDSIRLAKDSIHIVNSKVLKFYKQWNGTDSVKTLASDSTVIVDTLTDQTVRGTKNFRGSDSTYDKAPFGSEQMTTAGSGSGWTGNMVAGIVHTSGDATPFTGTLAAAVSNYYQITWTVTGYSAGTFSISFGGVSSNMTGLTASGVAGIQATTTGVNIVTPTSTLNTGATIIISIKQIGSTKAITKFSGFTSGVQEIRVFGTSNFMFGNSAGLRYISGTNNSAFSSNGLGSLTIGSNNTAIGINASTSLINGNANTSVGSGAGQANVYSSSNTLVGYATGQNTTGANNTVSGATAMFNNTTGANNVAFGVNAARYYTANASLTTVNNGTFIGYMAKALANNSTNELVIGYNAQGDGDNTSVIGNSSTTQTRVYGNTLYKTGTATVQWTSGTGSPESVVTANVGSMYTRTDGGAGTTLYIKESGVGNTGWTAK